MRKRMLWAMPTLLSLLLCGCAKDTDTVQQLPAGIVEQLDAVIEARMQEMNLPGVLVAVSIGGEGKYIVAKGAANTETHAPCALTDAFRIGSVTKAFVATAALRLVEQGKVALDDPLALYFPDFPNAARITVGDLLRMRSGIPDAVDPELLALLYENPLTSLSPEELISRSASWPERFEPPGIKVQYCNTNYVLLGEILEQVTGKEIGQIVRDSVLAPLGLTDTALPTGSRLPGTMHGYSWNPGREAFDELTILNPRWAGAAGGMTSTIRDLMTFAKALYEGSLLKPATLSARLEAATGLGLAFRH